LEPRYPITLRTRRRCYRGLVKLCGEYGILPNSYRIPKSKIEKLGDDPISCGGFSVVWPGMYKEHDNEEGKCVAIKYMRNWETDDPEKMRKIFFREVITWKRMSHPNILELIGVIMDDKEYGMVSPWMDNGNIVEFLREDLQANPLKLLEEATRGLQYLHGMELAHGNFKGANILISDEGRAYLTDVGLTRVAADLNTATNESNQSLPGGAGALNWCPPELLDPERFGSKRAGPTKKADIYSMAMTFYEVLTGKAPFSEHRDLVAMSYIIEGVRPNKPKFNITRGYTEELWGMTTRCWKEDSVERPTVDEVLEVLRVAAEQWKPKHGEISTLSLDDLSPTLYEEELDSPTVPEHVHEN